MSSSSAAATETPRARAQSLYKSYIDNPMEAFGGKPQALNNLNRNIMLNPYLKEIIRRHMKDTDLSLEFVETQIKPEHRDKVYTAIADATLTLGGGKRKSRKSKSRKSKKSKKSKKSRKN